MNIEKNDYRSFSERMSDYVAKVVGSWNFIFFQSAALIFWIFINIMFPLTSWDPYPFILLNLVLSFQAAFTAPIIMMSQNRQGEIDRQRSCDDYEINMKSEDEISQLHKKIDSLRENEISMLLNIINVLVEKTNYVSK
jgi:uncharacterized membrane protein